VPEGCAEVNLQPSNLGHDDACPMRPTVFRLRGGRIRKITDSRVRLAD
jgi:hypothetical protein